MTTLAIAAVQAIADLDADRAMLYCDLVLSALTDAARAGLEELMKTKYEYQSDVARKYLSEGHRAGARETLLRLVRRDLNRWGVQLDEGLAAGLDAAPLESLKRIEEYLAATDDPAGIEDVIRRHVEGADNGS